MNITIYTEDSRLGTAEIPPFIVGDSTAWTLMFQNSAGEFYSPAAVTVKLGHINGLADGSYPSAFRWVDRCRNEHVASIVVAAGVPTLTWANQPVGSMVGASGVYIVRGQIPDGRITGVVPSDRTIELTYGQGDPKSPTSFKFDSDSGGAGASGRIHWELKNYILNINILSGGSGYTTAPTVVFTGGGGNNAEAIATINDCGSVVDVRMTDYGCGYTSAPIVTFQVQAGNPGSGADAVCEWLDSDGSGAISAINLKNRGAGFTSAPTVTIADSLGTGSGAEAVAVGWDELQDLRITAQGSGYTSAPKMAFHPTTLVTMTAVATATITIATPGVVTWTAHGRIADDPVVFSTTVTLPTGIQANTTYYVSATGLTANTFQISTSVGGASIATSGSQSGVHSINSSCVVTWTGHGKAVGVPVIFSTTGFLPGGVTAGATYYVSATGLTANTFQFSTSVGGGGTPIRTTGVATFSGLQSGAHSARVPATVTISLANPCVVTCTGHGLAYDTPVLFVSTGEMPLTAGATYYVSRNGRTADTFELSNTIGGQSISTANVLTQSGVHTVGVVSAAATISGLGTITSASFPSAALPPPPSGGPSFLEIPFNFTGGGGTGATGSLLYQRYTTIENDNFVSKYRFSRVYVTNPGSGYTSNPTAQLYGATVTGERGAFTANLINAGSGYTGVPGITIAGGGGTGMTATVTRGFLTSILLSNTGRDYGAPIVNISGGGGTTVATAAVEQGNRGLRRFGVKFVEMLSAGKGYTSTPGLDGTIYFNGSSGNTLLAKDFIETIQSGIEFSELPFKRAESSPEIMGAVRLSGFSDGRYSGAGTLQYDHSALIVRPRTVATASLTAGVNNAGQPIWSGTLNPVNNYVTARLAVRRSTTLDMQVFGDGRMLFQGALTIIQKIP